MTRPADRTTTPPFIYWAIEQACPLREIDRWTDPEQTERQLRPLRAYCRAVAEDRVFEGICLHQSISQEHLDKPEAALGFSAQEILDAYGGQDRVLSLCGVCPANALQTVEDGLLAGCHGLLEVEGLETPLQDALETICRHRDDVAASFLTTAPRWPGLWANSPLSGKQVALLEELLTAVAEAHKSLTEKLRGVLCALSVCRSHNLPLHVLPVPAGRVEGDKWIVAAHCRRCRATRELSSQRCPICGLREAPCPSRRRNIRGQRPYWRLSGFMGSENVAPFLERYLEDRELREKRKAD